MGLASALFNATYLLFNFKNNLINKVMAEKLKAQINYGTGKIALLANDVGVTEEFIVKITDPLGNLTYKNSGYDAGDFTSPDVTASVDLTNVVMPTDTSGEVLQGDYTIEVYSRPNSHSFGQYFSWNITYCVELPTIDIGLEYSCRLATLTSQDNTDYAITPACNSGVVINADRTLYGHTLSYPTTTPTPHADVTGTDEIIEITDLWTKLWLASITTNVSYAMPISCHSEGILFEVIATLTGIKTIDVSCSDCLCSMYDCISQLVTNYSNNIDNNKALSDKYESLLIRLTALFMLYQSAERCGDEENVRSICSEITAFIDLSGLSCCSDSETNSYSVEVIAYGSAGGSGTTTTIAGTQWYSGSTDPSSSTGVDGDFYLQTTSHEIFKKISGTWTVIMTITFTGTLGNRIIDFNNTLTTVSAASFTDLYKYEFDAVDVIDGDILEMDSFITIHATSDNSVLRFSIVASSSILFDIPLNFDLGGVDADIDCHLTLAIKDVAGTKQVLYATLKAFSEGGVLFSDSVHSAYDLLTLANSISIQGYGSGGANEINKVSAYINHKKTI